MQPRAAARKRSGKKDVLPGASRSTRLAKQGAAWKRLIVAIASRLAAATEESERNHLIEMLTGALHSESSAIFEATEHAAGLGDSSLVCLTTGVVDPPSHLSSSVDIANVLSELEDHSAKPTRAPPIASTPGRDEQEPAAVDISPFSPAGIWCDAMPNELDARRPMAVAVPEFKIFADKVTADKIVYASPPLSSCISPVTPLDLRMT